MKVSEQMDAFYSLGRDPYVILAAPRIVAGLIATPILVGIANFIGIGAGMVAADLSLGLGAETFLYGARLFWHSWDVFYSFLKAITFGFAIPVIAIHMGFQTGGGGRGRRADHNRVRHVHDPHRAHLGRTLSTALPQLITMTSRHPGAAR